MPYANTPEGSDYTDPSIIDQLAELGITPEMLGFLGKQMNRGETMQDTPMAQGRQVGNTYVAANPLEHIANAVRQYQGRKMAQQSATGYQDQLGRAKEGIGAGMTLADRVTGDQRAELRRRQLLQQGTGGPIGPSPQMTPDMPDQYP